MSLLGELSDRLAGRREPLLIDGERSMRFEEIAADGLDLSMVRPGDVVAVIGRFDAPSVGAFLRLIDLGAILVPLSPETRPQHAYFIEAASIDVVIEGGIARRVREERPGRHPLIDSLRQAARPGLVFFSSGTTGNPKAILHDMTHFLARYRTPRPPSRMISFLNFDHVGGINTLMHTLFSGGTVVVPPATRDPAAVLELAAQHGAEVLPATPTFLRMLLLGGRLDAALAPSLRVITYGTEPMDQGTLSRLCELLPSVDFRQTYGTSETGILRVKSRARDSLWMQVGGEGVSTEVRAGVLFIQSRTAMLGYLNAPSPFDERGWYDTRDLVEVDGPWIRVTGRTDQLINVAGVKVFPQEVEQAGLLHAEVLRCKAYGRSNPITGQHVEVDCEFAPGATATLADLRAHFRRHLPARVWPARVRIAEVPFSHRLKRL